MVRGEIILKVQKNTSEISQKCEEHVKIEGELESVEQLVKELGKEKKAEKKHAREELAVESTHIHQINEMIEKLSKERIVSNFFMLNFQI